MSPISQTFWNVPAPMPAPAARLVIVLAVLISLLAAWGLFLFDGLRRVLFVLAFSTMSASNLLWAMGSLDPDSQRSASLRAASRPFGVVMLVALPLVAWLEYFT